MIPALNSSNVTSNKALFSSVGTTFGAPPENMLGTNIMPAVMQSTNTTAIGIKRTFLLFFFGFCSAVPIFSYTLCC